MSKIYLTLLPILKKQKKLKFVAKRKSMLPLISPENKVVVSVGLISSASIDDIIAFYNKKIDKIIIHRIKYIDNINGERKITTKPDAYNYLDKESVTKKNYLGKVDKIIKKNKTISLEKNNFSFLKHNFKQPIYREILSFYFKTLVFLFY